MADNFGLKIGLEGEKEFKSAIADINRSFKVLGSEMKVVTSQFSKNDTSVDALTARNQVLNKEIEAQKQKITVLNQALANASSSFGENDRRTQAWQIQLNNATAALNTMERELKQNDEALNNVAKEFDDAEDQADQFGDEVKDAGNQSDDAKGKFSGLGTACKTAAATITAAFAAVSTAAIAGAKALVDMTTEGAAYADEVLTTASQTGIATDKLQEYMYAAELVDVSTETLTKSMAKQIKSMKAVQDGTALSVEAYEKLGVQVTNADGSLRDSDTVYWEVIDSLGKMENETERDALAMQILGKSAQELNPLIEQGAERMAELGEQAHEAGYVVNDEMLNAYGALDDQLQYLNVGATAAKNALGTVLLPVLTDLATEGNSLLNEFTNGILDANGDISKMSDVIGGILPKVLDMIMQFLPELLEIAGEIVGSLASAIVDNLPTIIDTATQIIFSLLQGLIDALPKIAEGALQLVMALVGGILENLPLLIETALQVIVTLATGIAEALPTLIPSIVQVIIQIVQTLIENLPMILDAAIQIVMGLIEGILAAIPILIEALPALITSIIDFILGAIPQLIDAGIQLFMSLIGALPEIITAIVEAIPQIIEGLLNAIMENLPLIIESGINMMLSLLDGIIEAVPQLIEYIPVIIEKLLDAIVNNLPLIIKMGITMIISLAKGLIQAIPQIVQKIPQLISSIVKALKNGVSKIGEIGKNFVQGLWNGISDAAGWVMDKIKGFGSSILDGIKGFFGIHSPSTVFKDQVGKNLALGVGEGFTAAMKGVTSDMEHAIPTEFDTDVIANVTSGVRGSIQNTGVQGAVAPIQNIIQFGDVTLKNDLDIEYVAHKISDILTRDLMNKGGAFA